MKFSFFPIFSEILCCALYFIKKLRQSMKHGVKAAKRPFVMMPISAAAAWPSAANRIAISQQVWLMFYLMCCADLENYLTEGLKGESLSKKAKEKREAFIKRIKEVKQRCVCTGHTLKIIVLMQMHMLLWLTYCAVNMYLLSPKQFSTWFQGQK